MAEGDAAPALAIGRLEGRLGALEERMGRHEDKIDAKMDSLEAKIDGLHAKLDAKVDEILTYKAQREALLSAAKWLIGMLVALSGWTVFWRGHH
jgi:hypothetical protein